MPTSINLVGLTWDQRDEAAALLARAFAQDPVYAELTQDPASRLRALESMFRGVVSYVLRYGEVWTTENLWGVACWLPPGETDVTIWRMLRNGFALGRGMRGFEPQVRRTFLRVFSRLDESRKRWVPEPHWYLWVIGVAPDRQGHGVGGGLLRPILARADEMGAPCYLETQTSRNVAFYQRRGFEVVHEETPEEIGLPIWSMVRRPQG